MILGGTLKELIKKIKEEITGDNKKYVVITEEFYDALINNIYKEV